MKWMKNIQNSLYYFIIILDVSAIIHLFFIDDMDFKRVMLFNIAQYTFMLFVFSLPKIFKEKMNITIPTTLHFIVALFAFSGFILGDVFGFYDKFIWWDSLLHILSGFLLSYVALWIIDLLIQNTNYIYLNKYFVSIFVVCFSLACGALWEIGEYTFDSIFGTNTQQYMQTTTGSLTSEEDIPLVGHEALNDTMKDLILDLGGCSLVALLNLKKNKYD